LKLSSDGVEFTLLGYGAMRLAENLADIQERDRNDLVLANPIHGGVMTHLLI
jgi:hypothetical protein